MWISAENASQSSSLDVEMDNYDAGAFEIVENMIKQTPVKT